MAGIAYYASTKLTEAAKFLKKQSSEMDTFATSIEGVFDKVNLGYDAAIELINEIKSSLLPSYNELIDNLKNNEAIKNTLAELKGQASKVDTTEISDKVKELVNEEINQNQSDIQESINEGKAKLQEIGASEYLSKTVSFLEGLDFLFSDAHAAFKGLAIKPSCFKRGRRFPVMDEDCKCRRNRSCMTSRLPESLKLKRRDDFVVLATKNALSLSKANDYILSGRPREGISIYKKLAPMAPKVEKSSMALLYNKKSKFYSEKNILNLTDSIRKSTKEGLGTYLSHNQKEMGAYLKPVQISNSSKGSDGPADIVLEKLRGDILTAKNLGNPSFVDLKIEAAAREDSGEDVYNYSQETIIRDPSIDIFQMIKKRYMQVHADGRL